MNIPSVERGKLYLIKGGVYKRRDQEGILIGECIDSELLVSNPNFVFRGLIILQNWITLGQDQILTVNSSELQRGYFQVESFPFDELPLYIHHEGRLPYFEEYLRTKTF